MTYGAVPSPPTRPAGGSGDLVASVVLLVLAGGLVVLLGFAALLFSAFLDYCPPETCNAGGAVASAWGGLLAAVILGALGTALTLRRRGSGRLGWPAALTTLLLCVLAGVAGFVGYFTLVG